MLDVLVACKDSKVTFYLLGLYFNRICDGGGDVTKWCLQRSLSCHIREVMEKGLSQNEMLGKDESIVRIHYNS